MHQHKQRGFRSRREKWTLTTISGILTFIVVMKAQIQEPPLVEILAWSLAIWLPAIIGVWVWQRWGRKRFPLPPSSEHQPAA